MVKKTFLNFNSGASRVIINFSSRAISAVSAIIFVPVYIRLMGIESYGLVAFYATLAGSLTLLDLGLSTAVTRQVTVLRVGNKTEKELHDLIFSVELIYWIVGLVVGTCIFFLAPFISQYWVKANNLPVPVINRAVQIMGFVFALQFPSSIYTGALIGLDKQNASAIATVLFAIIKVIFTVGVLKLISPTVEWYFIAQIISTAAFSFFLAYLTKKSLGRSKIKSKFSVAQLNAIKRFAAGMFGIAAVTFFLNQADKIIVSKFVLLEFVGYYNLAFTLGAILTQTISPLQTVIFPKFSALVAQQNTGGLLALYHKGCRWIAIAIFPAGFTLVFFAKEILMLWTKNPTLSNHTAPMLRIVTIGMLCNCLMWMPYFLMLAKGNTRFTIYQNIIASIISMPLLLWWTIKFGAYGASWVWLCINAGYIIFSLPLFHKFFLKGQLWTWVIKDNALPLAAAAGSLLLVKFCQRQWLGNDVGRYQFFLLMSGAGTLYIFLIPELKANFIRFFQLLEVKLRR